MEKSMRMGFNRTGTDTSPQLTKEMIIGADKFSPRAIDGNKSLASIESWYIHKDSAVGSVPIPATIKGAAKSITDKLAGHNPEVFINKLGQRLAFERSGVRLYEGFIRKCEALDGAASAVPLRELRQLCSEEAEHFQMLCKCMESLGCDPTAQTPDADVSAVASMGLVKVIADPRTSVSQCLEALLTAELTDNAAWELLVTMSEEMGLNDMAKDFGEALKQEDEHLKKVNQWYRHAITTQVEMAQDTSH